MNDIELNFWERIILDVVGEGSILIRALRYEHERGFDLPYKEEARSLLYMIEDKPHLSIKYISEMLQKVAESQTASVVKAQEETDV